MLIGVKFCGGCNPRYERGEFLKRINTHFGEKASFELAKEEGQYDGILVLGGCSNCCPEYEHFNTKTDPILVWDQIHLEDVVASIERNIQKKD